MYAVINAGGKQERVKVGELVDVELLDAAPGDELQLTPLLVVDGDEVVATAPALASARVMATVIGETKGPKIDGFTYKSKSRQRRRYGHRQRYTTLEITAIDGPAAPKKAGRSKASAKANNDASAAPSGDTAGD
jgi:large subunit ribosomal protein L21